MVLATVRVLNNITQTICFNRKSNFLEGNSSTSFQFRVLLMVPAKGGARSRVRYFG